MAEIGPCRLCERVRKLQLSHINPKFVYRFQRKTTLTTIRSHINPNRPAQDSRKLYFLCDECEVRLSRWETLFKRNIYDPYHAGTLTEVKYGPWFLKFAVSISWRSLKATLEVGADEIKAGRGMRPEFLSEAAIAESVWRDFLLDRRKHPGRFPQYFFPLELLANSPNPDWPINFATYIQRAAASGIWHDPAREFMITYGMMCSVAVIGVIFGRNLRSWGERIRVEKGILRKSSHFPPVTIVEMIRAQANDHLMMSRSLSERQKRLDHQKLVSDEERFANSEYLRAMAIDVGRAARGDPRIPKRRK